MSEHDGRRRRGRHNEAARNDRAVIEAAREVFLAQGFDAPVAAVAERAGCGMGSLYRRFRTKEELLQRMCVDAMEYGIAALERGLAHEDPWAGLVGYLRDCVEFGTGALAPVAGTIETTPEMWRTARRAIDLVERLVARAHAAGVLRADVTALDLSLLIERFSRREGAEPVPETDNTRRRLLAIAIAGLRAGDHEPLPGHPPSLEAYGSRWRSPASDGDRAGVGSR